MAPQLAHTKRFHIKDVIKITPACIFKFFISNSVALCKFIFGLHLWTLAPRLNHFLHPVINAVYSSHGAASRTTQNIADADAVSMATAGCCIPPTAWSRGLGHCLLFSLGWLSSLSLRGNLTQQQQAKCVCVLARRWNMIQPPSALRSQSDSCSYRPSLPASFITVAKIKSLLLSPSLPLSWCRYVLPQYAALFTLQLTNQWPSFYLIYSELT